MKRLANFVDGFFAHVEDFDPTVVRQGGSGMMEKPSHGAGEAGDDANVLPGSDEIFEALILAGGHFAEIGDALEGGSGIAKAVEDAVLDRCGHGLREGAAAVKNSFGGVAHGERAEG